MTNQSAQRQIPPFVIIGLSVMWQLTVAVAAVFLSVTVLRMDTLSILGKPADLGQVIKLFAAFISFLPAVLALIASVLLLMRHPSGRFLSMVFNFGGFALALFALLGAWEVYDSFEHIVDAILNHAPLTLGFALAYVLFLLAGRFESAKFLERVSFIIAALSLGLILFFSKAWLALSHVAGTYTSLQTWLISLASFLFLFLFWQLIKLGPLFGETPPEREAWQGWLMLSPNIIGFILFFAGPLLLSFYLSFTNSSVGQVPQVTGLANYTELLSVQIKRTTDTNINAQNTLDFGYALVREFRFGNTRYIFGAKDSLFWISLWNTLAFCIFLLPLAIAPALGMALILNSSLPGMRFFRAIYFLPSVAAVVGTALIWRWLYTPTTGFINYSITTITGWLGINDPKIEWLSDPNVVLIAIVLLAAWQVVGYNTVLFLAGLQGIPRSLYEASAIDGANPFQRFRNVTLPLLAPTTFFVGITTMVTGLQVFNEPFTLFPARPIPEDATTLVYYLYVQGFNQFQFGYASAIAWVLFLLIFTLTFIQFRLNRSDAYA